MCVNVFLCVCVYVPVCVPVCKYAGLNAEPLACKAWVVSLSNTTSTQLFCTLENLKFLF